VVSASFGASQDVSVASTLLLLFSDVIVFVFVDSIATGDDNNGIAPTATGLPDVRLVVDDVFFFVVVVAVFMTVTSLFLCLVILTLSLSFGNSEDRTLSLSLSLPVLVSQNSNGSFVVVVCSLL
jgi:hypothetical protein